MEIRITMLPEHHANTLSETLRLDAESSAFDASLRREIQEALDSEEVITHRLVSAATMLATVLPEESELMELNDRKTRALWLNKGQITELQKLLDMLKVKRVNGLQVSSHRGHVKRKTRCHVRGRYTNFEEFEHCCGVYGLHDRVGYKDPLSMWNDNPMIESSVDPRDFRIVKSRKKK